MSLPSLRPAIAAWNRFWFEPTPTSTLALVRIAFGLVVLAWAVSLAGELFPFFGRQGSQPSPPRSVGSWGVLELADGDVALLALYASLVIAAGALVVGFHTRMAAVVVFVSLLSFERRAPFVFNAGDHLLRVLAFYIMLAPAGAALSVDGRRAGRAVTDFPERAPWGLRLIQLQLTVLYLAAVWAKVRGTTWNDGTAVSYALRLTDLERFPIPGFLTDLPATSTLLTYSTLAIELGLALLVWNRRLRPWVLSLGVLMHLGIDWSLRVGFFSLAVFVMYVAFIPPERASDGIRRARERLLDGKRGLGSPAARLPRGRRQGAPQR